MTDVGRGYVPALVVALLLAGCMGQPSNETPPVTPTTEEPSPQERRLTWANASEAIIRPGVDISDGSCTANFIFRSPSNDTVYIGTAAHCFDNAGPNNDTSTELNETVILAAGEAEGRLAFMGARYPDLTENRSRDFALVQIFPQYHDVVYPGMYAYDGPTGIADDVAVGDTVWTFGNSTFRDDVDGLDARDGTITDARWGDGHVRAMFRPPSLPGDSGSPVVTSDGRAVGTLVTFDFFHLTVPRNDDLPSAGSNGIGWLPWSLKHVRDTSDLEPILVTAPEGSNS